MNAIQIDDVETALRNRYIERFTAAWHKSREYVVELGRILLQAKAELARGTFLAMIEDKLPLGPRACQQLMAIASDHRLTDARTSSHLPDSYEALDEIRKLDDEKLAGAIISGDIHPAMTVADARALIGKPREAVFVEPRKPEELKLPIIGPTDFLATMKGYRVLKGIPQSQVDAAAGMDGWNYIGKLEIDVRRAVNESAWDWLNALGLVMIVVKAVDAVRTDKCPCCGGSVK